MKLEEIKNSIQFKEIDLFEQEQKLLEATLKVSSSVIITKELLLSVKDPNNMNFLIKENLTRRILHEVYNDRRQELVNALMDVLGANPMSQEIHDAKSRLINAAMYQQPL